MAKRKDKDSAGEKARKIPIEGVGGEEAEEVATGASVDGVEGVSGTGAGTDTAAADVAADVAADDGGAVEGASEDAAEASAEDDLVAEAEAIVEEASAADQLADAQKQAQEWQDRYLRLHAEWDTYRRRTTEQRAEEKERATEKLVEALIPVLDDFDRTVAYADENGETGLLDGVKAVQVKLLDALTKSGMVVIDPAGEAYDALEAQAVATVPDEQAYDETVRDVYQKGYRMGKKVLRPAMVTVTTGGPQRPKEEASEES